MIAAEDKWAKIIAIATVALGIVVAVKISPLVLPASLIMIISVIMRVCEQNLNIEMLWFFDAGVALAILALMK